MLVPGGYVQVRSPVTQLKQKGCCLSQRICRRLHSEQPLRDLRCERRDLGVGLGEGGDSTGSRLRIGRRRRAILITRRNYARHQFNIGTKSEGKENKN